MAVETIEMHKVPPTWLGLDMCGPVVCGSLKFVRGDGRQSDAYAYASCNRWP
jgi:hypothetical protein